MQCFAVLQNSWSLTSLVLKTSTIKVTTYTSPHHPPSAIMKILPVFFLLFFYSHTFIHVFFTFTWNAHPFPTIFFSAASESLEYLPFSRFFVLFCFSSCQALFSLFSTSNRVIICLDLGYFLVFVTKQYEWGFPVVPISVQWHDGQTLR